MIRQKPIFYFPFYRRTTETMKFRLLPAVATLLVLTGCVFVAQADLFEPLFKITSVKGNVSIVRPGSTEPETAREEHTYPYGSRLIVPKWKSKSKAVEPEVGFSLSRDHRFRLSGVADLTVGSELEGHSAKKIFTLKSGKLKTYISVSTVKTGGVEDEAVEAGIQALSVVTPLATCTRLTERNQISVSPKDGNYTVMIVTESGTMEVAGPQFRISSMRRNAAVEIFGDADYTRILNVAADFTVELEKGADGVEEVLFRPRCVGKIWRSYAEIGGKQAVSVMIAFPDGSINSYAYMQGEAVAVDSTFVSKGQPPAEGSGVVPALTDEAVFDTELPGASVLDPIDATVKPQDADGGDVLDAFNFDDWTD